ncbi:MAG: YhcH/YjgK/YiaL family protein [Chthoniobacterales bacterium]|jgi:biofilm protein TabA
MILDTHDNLRNYAGFFRGVDPQPLFDWLATCRDIPPGQKIDFAGDKLFAKTLRQDTGSREAFRWEAHREYVDLQYILGGGEIIEWAPAAKLVPDGAYDAKTDFQFYAPAEADVLLPMTDGLFVFLFPTDGHKPLVSNGADRHVHKIIAKIHRSLLAI